MASDVELRYNVLGNDVAKVSGGGPPYLILRAESELRSGQHTELIEPISATQLLLKSSECLGSNREKGNPRSSS